jgi:hypothetical protein
MHRTSCVCCLAHSTPHRPTQQTDGAGGEGGGGLKVSPHRLQQHRGPISPKEVEEASRILFAPPQQSPSQQQQQQQGADQRKRAQSVEGSYEDVAHNDADLDASMDQEAGPVPPPMFRGGSRSGVGVGGLSSLASPTPTVAPMQRPSTASSRPASPQPQPSAPASASSSSLVGQLHPKPAVHAEILRFGMALAANPRIQSVIREELEMRGQGAGLAVEDGEGGQGLGEEGMASAVRRLCGGLAALEGGGSEDDDDDGAAVEWGAGAAAGGGGGGYGSISSFLTASYEMVGLAGGGGGSAEEGSWGPEPPGASFLSLGRSIRRHDAVAGSAVAGSGDAPEVSEEVLDELLRSDDEDDAITQKMFASTPDEHVRRYLRNLDLECVICHEYMVEATAVDCGEGHTFCRECIERWLAEAEEAAVARGDGSRGRGRGKSCPTCQNAVAACIPMRQYDGMIEKYVRASNLWDEITSYYRRKTLARMRRELELEAAEEEAARRRREAEQGAGGRASAAFMNAFAGLGSLFGGGRDGGGGGGVAGLRRRQRGRAAGGSASSVGGGNATATEHHGPQQEAEGSHEGGGREERWWKSEILHTALSVATMLILVVLFRRGVKVR